MKTPSGAPEAPAAPCTRWSLADFSRSSYHFKEQGGRGSHGEGIPAGPSGSPPPLFPALLPAPPRASSEAFQRPPPSAARGEGLANGAASELRVGGRRGMLCLGHHGVRWWGPSPPPTTPTAPRSHLPPRFWGPLPLPSQLLVTPR